MAVDTPDATEYILGATDSSSFIAARFFTTAMTASEHHELYRQARKTVPGYIFQPLNLNMTLVAGGGGGEA
jgi:hypothetical protein